MDEEKYVYVVISSIEEDDYGDTSSYRLIEKIFSNKESAKRYIDTDIDTDWFESILEDGYDDYEIVRRIIGTMNKSDRIINVTARYYIEEHRLEES